MNKTNTSTHEAARLKDLAEYEILDTPTEIVFDEIASLAALMFQTPIAIINVLDEKRAWAKARVGVAGRELPRDLSFCKYFLDSPEMLVVGDLSKDPRFMDHPLVAGPEAIRFYAGCPILSENGSVIGALCIIDKIPTEISAIERWMLQALASQAQSQFALRRAKLKIEKDSDVPLERINPIAVIHANTVKLQEAGSNGTLSAEMVLTASARIAEMCRKLEIAMSKEPLVG